MTARLLAPIEPRNPGTPWAESFLSVLHRIAHAHNVSLLALRRFIKPHTDNPHVSRLGYRSFVPGLMGVSSEAQAIVTATEALTGVGVLRNHGLWPLRGVLSPRALGFFNSRQRWCPECLRVEEDEAYGLLAYQAVWVTRCPKHGSPLLEECGRCYASQPHNHFVPFALHCRSCGADLRALKGDGWTLDRTWEEEQCLDLISYLTDPDRPRPSATWFEDNRGLLHELGLQALGRFRGAAAQQAKLLRRLPDQGLTFSTLLWLAATHSTTVVEVLLRPSEVLVGVIPGLDPVPRRPSSQMRKSTEAWADFRKICEWLLENQERAYLPPKSTLADLFGFNSYGYRDPALLRTYGEARNARKPRGANVDFECRRRLAAGLLGHSQMNYQIARLLRRREMKLSGEMNAKVNATIACFRTVRGATVNLVVPDALRRGPRQ